MDYQKMKGYGNLMALIGFLLTIIGNWNPRYDYYDGYFPLYYDIRYLGRPYWQPHHYMVVVALIGFIIAIIGIIMFTIGMIKSGKSIEQGPPGSPAPPYPQTPSYADYLCRKCEKQLTFIPAYSTWYCYNCRTYPGSEDMIDKRKPVDSDSNSDSDRDEGGNN